MEKLRQLGPVSEYDENFLKSVIQLTCPRILVEFGHQFGYSARAMLEAMSEDSVLHSYDNTVNSKIDDKRFVFHNKSQTDFENIENVDFVFIDASHDCFLNIKTFNKILPCLSKNAVILIHDTGTWTSNVYNFDRGFYAKDGNYIHCIGERKFSNWLLDNHSEFSQIHLHSNREIRHGMTILQRKTRLSEE